MCQTTPSLHNISGIAYEKRLGAFHCRKFPDSDIYVWCGGFEIFQMTYFENLGFAQLWRDGDAVRIESVQTARKMM